MPLPQFKVTKYKDGRVVQSFRDTQGRVRTVVGISENRWTRAEQVRELADYGILLQLAQLDQGLGSDGMPMKALSARYASWKARVGLEPKRNLLGLGGRPVVTNTKGVQRQLRSARYMAGRGHMRDDIRVSYVDDQKATITISNEASRIKARANETKAPWWGWSPASYRLMQQRAAQLWGAGPAERLFQLGMIGASALAFARARILRRAA